MKHAGEYVDTLEKLARGEFLIGEFNNGRFTLDLYYEGGPLSKHDREGLDYWKLDGRIIEMLECHDAVNSADQIYKIRVPKGLRTLAIYVRQVRELVSGITHSADDRHMTWIEAVLWATKAYKTPKEFPADVHPEIGRRIDEIVNEMRAARESVAVTVKRLEKISHFEFDEPSSKRLRA